MIKEAIIKQAKEVGKKYGVTVEQMTAKYSRSNPTPFAVAAAILELGNKSIVTSTGMIQQHMGVSPTVIQASKNLATGIRKKR